MRNARAGLRGAGSVMDLAGAGRYRLYGALLARRGAGGGLALDWAAVGGDLRRAVDGVADRTETAGPNHRRV